MMNILYRYFLKYVLFIVIILSGYILAIAQNNFTFQQLVDRKIRATDSLNILYPNGNYPQSHIGEPKTSTPQDCKDAVNVCTSSYNQTSSFTNYGNIQEIPNPSGYGNCLISSEHRTAWYVFTVQTSGEFGFTLATSYDYDYALYDITTIGCSGVPTATPVRCNYSAAYGNTGMNTVCCAGNTSEGAGGSAWCKSLTVSVGQTYALVIDNYTQDNTGYLLTFGGTASIWDVTNPTLTSAVSNCNHTITVTFSEFIQCSSILLNSFTLSGPSAITITGAVGINCTTNGLTKTATITYTGGTVSGVYTVGIGTSPPTDKCGFAITVGGTTTVQIIDIITATATPPIICSGQNSSLTVNEQAAMAGETYSWTPSASLSNATIYNPTVNIPLTTTIYTVNVTYGGCTKSTTATVTVQNPPVVTINPMNPVLCSGTQVLTASSTLNGSNCATCTYSWTGGYTGTSNPTPAQGAGTYNVIAITAAPTSCPSSMATSTISLNTLTSTCNIFYVSPAGGGSGLTPASPTTLQTAITAAQCAGATIKMAIGVYPTLTNYITINSNTIIEGGYNSAFTTKTSNMTGGINSTTIRRDNTADGGAGINVTAFKVTAGASNFRFQDIRIEMPGSASVPANQVGTTKTNYAIYLGSGCSNYNIVRCYIDAGAGATGSTGSVGAAASTAGSNGSGATRGVGAISPAGDGGNGGAGGTFAGASGATGGLANGVAAGGGAGGGPIWGNCGTTGWPGPNVGGNGSSGWPNGNIDGVSPVPLVNAAPASSFTYASNTYYVPGGVGATGLSGTQPKGGCGGGGGGYLSCSTGTSSGGSGGGGGGGGKNGDGGLGGGPGGGAFGVFSIVHGAGNTILSCYITASAGAGGAGGTGGAGSNGGQGASGLTNLCYQNSGGSGDRGGFGNVGGTGGYGAVGDFASVCDLNGTTLTKTAYANTNIHTQSIITVTNISCTATNIGFTSPASDVWSFGAGATYGGANPTQNPVNVTYAAASLGFKDIVYNGTTYNGFVHLITDAPTNTIASSALGVCPGANANFTSNQGSSSGFSFVWSVPAPPSGVSATFSGSTTTSSADVSFTNSNSTTQVVTVQLVVTSQCCGAATITKNINVYPLPSISYVSDNSTPCIGGSVVYTASSVPVGASFTWWNAATAGSQLGAGTTYTFTPVVSGQNNDVWIEATNSNGCLNSSRLNADANGTATPSPTPVNGTTCSVGDVLLSVANVTGAVSYNWYSANCSGLLQSSISPVYIAPNVSSNTTFYASVVVGSCAQSACVPVTATLTNTNPAILTWEGDISNDWFDQRNWDANACPPGCGTEVVISSIVSFEPRIDQSAVYNSSGLPASCGKLTISNGRTLTLNKADLEICGNYTQNGRLDMLAGTVTFNGSTQQKFTRTSTSTITGGNGANDGFISAVINNPAGVKVIEGVGYKDFITSMLTLTSGKVTTEGGRALQVTSTASSAISGHSPGSYITGWLKRSVISGVSYEFPVGNASNYELMRLDITSVSGGLINLTTWFYNPPSDAGTGFPIIADAGKYVSPLVNIGGGIGNWVVIPNTGSANYNMTLYSTSCTGLGSNEHTIVKRNTYDCSGINSWGIAGTWVSSSGNPNLTVVRNSLSGFSKFSIAKALWPLPIELIFFDGVCNAKENSVVLSWITASETNNNFFAIERSIDGETFVQIGNVKGAGNSSVTNHYSFIVQNFSGTISYYRLKQTDYDGTTAYSSEISVDCSAISEFELINMIPNPAKDNLYVIFKDGIEELITITVFDVIGKKIFSEKITSMTGINNKQLDVTNLSTGSYFIHITNGEKTFIKKIFK